MSLILDFEGFQLGPSQFIVKEMAAHAVGDPTYRGRWTFRPPYAFKKLSKRNQYKVSWVTRYIHGMPWTDGELVYTELDSILRVLSRMFQKIYVKGLEKKKFIEKIMRRDIYNLDDLQCPRLHEWNLAVDPCPYSHMNDGEHCAVKKASVYAAYLGIL